MGGPPRIRRGFGTARLRSGRLAGQGRTTGALVAWRTVGLGWMPTSDQTQMRPCFILWPIPRTTRASGG